LQAPGNSALRVLPTAAPRNFHLVPAEELPQAALQPLAEVQRHLEAYSTGADSIHVPHELLHGLLREVAQPEAASASAELQVCNQGGSIHLC